MLLGDNDEGQCGPALANLIAMCLILDLNSAPFSLLERVLRITRPIFPRNFPAPNKNCRALKSFNVKM